MNMLKRSMQTDSDKHRVIAHIKKGRKAVRAIRRLKRATRAINRIEEINEKRERIRAIRREVLAYGDDIIHSDRFEKAKHVSHHIKFTVAIHSVEVAMYALLIVRALKRRHLATKVDERDLVRAALLHDIGMTNDQVHDSPSYKKAFSHPKEGLRIARDEFHLNKIQLNAIHRHMWPIGIIPPQHITGWILTMADNMSSFNEGTAMLKEKLRKRRERAKEKLREKEERLKEKLK